MYSLRVSVSLCVIALRIFTVSCRDCRLHSDCPEYAYCSSNVCRCNRNFLSIGDKCLGMDKCKMKNTCSENAICDNRNERNPCTCISGYVGDGYTCIDKDECNEMKNVCYAIETCQNEQGDFKCLCNGNVCHYAAYCLNDRGQIGCICGHGFAGDGLSCDDVNECVEGTHNCTDEEICENTNGSFKCSSSFLLLRSQFFILSLSYIMTNIFSHICAN